MLDILVDYCNIFVGTKEWERKKRHKLNQEWYQKIYENMPNYTEIKKFLDRMKEILSRKDYKLFKLKIKETYDHGSMD